MMKHSNNFIFSLLLIAITTVFSPSVYALDVIDQSSNVFKFQHKLAIKGNARAQFKLACMYESGEGTELNIEQAKHWYSLASKAGMKAAGDRYTYLMVKEQGYDQAKHSDWLASIKTDAKTHKSAAMFLLGQLYREGLGVNKDLNKSFKLLSEVSVSGDADVDDDLAMIQEEIEAENKAKLQKKREKEKARVAQAKKEQQQKELKAAKEPQKEQKTTKEQESDAEQVALAEKVRKYEKAMMQLHREQQLINDQQAWSAGGAAQEADDEI
jgi:TPR repeat protein